MAVRQIYQSGRLIKEETYEETLSERRNRQAELQTIFRSIKATLTTLIETQDTLTQDIADLDTAIQGYDAMTAAQKNTVNKQTMLLLKKTLQRQKAMLTLDEKLLRLERLDLLNRGLREDVAS